jgi:hypothetical protein
MDVTRDVSQNSKENVDQQVGATTLDQKDSKRRNEDLFVRGRSLELDGYRDDNDDDCG